MDIRKKLDKIDGSSLKDTLDYQEAFTNKEKGPIYLGSLQGEVGNMRNDIEKLDTKSEFYGKLFCPERPGRKDHVFGATTNWSYQKNMSYMAGVIDSGREVILTTPITSYGHDKIGITTHELLWLHNNGYTFEPNPSNLSETIAKPPSQRSPAVMQNYIDQNDQLIDPGTMLEQIAQIKEEVLQKKELLIRKDFDEKSKIEVERLTKENKYIPIHLRQKQSTSSNDPPSQKPSSSFKQPSSFNTPSTNDPPKSKYVVPSRRLSTTTQPPQPKQPSSLNTSSPNDPPKSKYVIPSLRPLTTQPTPPKQTTTTVFSQLGGSRQTYQPLQQTSQTITGPITNSPQISSTQPSTNNTLTLDVQGKQNDTDDQTKDDKNDGPTP